MRTIRKGDKDYELYESFQTHVIGGVRIKMPPPDPIPEMPFVGREGIIEDIRIGWYPVLESKYFNVFLNGPTGTGKNALVYQLAKMLKKDLYIMRIYAGSLADDIVCIARFEDDGKNSITYVASPLTAAVHLGGICFFDEIGKVPPDLLVPLHSLLDDCKTITSTQTALRLHAHKDFRFCAAFTDEDKVQKEIQERDALTFDLDYPAGKELEAVLKAHYPIDGDQWTRLFILEFKDRDISTRNAVNILRFARNHYARGKKTATIIDEAMMKRSLEVAYSYVVPRNGNCDVVPEEPPENLKNSIKDQIYDIFPSFSKKSGVH